MLPLTAIICTHHREEAVAETLALLFGPRVQSARSIDLRVILVDQGRTLQRTDFPADWNLRIVHQDNFGGAGGFTRGMIEAMDEGAGWILLMDDDATPDPASFPILADYIRGRAPETRFALHGAMFSYEEPDTIYEAGATIREPRDRNFDIVQRLRGYKPSEPIGKDPALWENMEIDYGAWWFFCINTDSVRQVGLPLPLFIRGDDREYGLRLKRAGIPTLPLPGLRIWHTAQGVRADTWPMFFDQRNKLIVHALYSNGGSWSLAARMIYSGLRDVLAARFDVARLSAAGLAAYLEGPASLENHPDLLLEKVRKLAATDAIKADQACQIDMLGKIKRGRLIRLILQLLALNGLLLPANKSSLLPVGQIGSFEWLRTWRLSRYGLKGSSDYVNIYRRSRRRSLTLAYQLICDIARYVTTFHYTAAAWRRAASRMQKRTFWASFLRTPQSPPFHDRI